MRQFLVLAGLFVSSLSFAAEPLTIDVHRDANCGCCKAWISHLQDNGFNVVDHVETDMSAVKQRLGVPPRLSSCHTGVINGQFVEGHVPAADILKCANSPTYSARPCPVCRPAHRAWNTAMCATLIRSSAWISKAQSG